MHRARAIRALDLRVGALSGIVADSVRFYFEVLSRDTLAEGATLRFEIVLPRALPLMRRRTRFAARGGRD